MKENQNPCYDSPAFGSTEVFEVKVRDENCKDIGDISMDNETIAIDSKRMDYQNGLSDLAGIQEEGLHFLPFDTHDNDEKSVTGEELKTPCIGNVYEVSISSPCDEASDLLETSTNVFTDKNVLECELSELEVLKDICVDEGTHEMKGEKDCNSSDQEKLTASSESSSEEDNAEHRDLPELQQAATKYSDDDSLVDKKHQDICVDDGMPEIRGDKDGKSVDQERQVSSSVSSTEKDTAEHCDLPELEQETTKYSEDDSLVGKKDPVQEAGALVLIGSFPYTSDGEAKKILLSTDQIEVGNNSDSLTQNSPIENAVAVGAASSSSEPREPKDNILAGSILFDRNIKSGRITFDFSDTEHNNTTLDLNKQPSDSSATSHIQDISSEKQHIDVNSDDFSSDVQALKNQLSTKDDAFIPTQILQYDRGETSFSTVTYSDPIAFSRSLSHRSDASTASTRSFAFPVLQSEWNSSPVRMAKPDRRHFRKQKGWRSGFLCCRF